LLFQITFAEQTNMINEPETNEPSPAEEAEEMEKVLEDAARSVKATAAINDVGYADASRLG
jgi:hypothetical protein